MNKAGHYRFSLLLLAIGIYIVNDFDLFPISYLVVLIHLPLFLLGVRSPDLLEPALSIAHRSWWHSRTFFMILTFIIIPILVSLTIYYPYKDFSGIQFSKYSLLLSFWLGFHSHVLGDSFTSKLRG